MTLRSRNTTMIREHGSRVLCPWPAYNEHTDRDVC